METAAAILVQTLFEHTNSLQNLLADAVHSGESIPKNAKAASEFVEPFYRAMFSMVKKVSSGQA